MKLLDDTEVIDATTNVGTPGSYIFLVLNNDTAISFAYVIMCVLFYIGYMAPEIKSETYTTAVDVFSYSMIIFCVLTNTLQPQIGELSTWETQFAFSHEKRPEIDPKSSSEIIKTAVQIGLVECMERCWYVKYRCEINITISKH